MMPWWGWLLASMWGGYGFICGVLNAIELVEDYGPLTILAAPFWIALRTLMGPLGPPPGW